MSSMWLGVLRRCQRGRATLPGVYKSCFKCVTLELEVVRRFACGGWFGEAVFFDVPRIWMLGLHILLQLLSRVRKYYT